jgi:hypothetical protein
VVAELKLDQVMLQDAQNLPKNHLEGVTEKGPINFAEIVLNCVLKDGGRSK